MTPDAPRPEPGIRFCRKHECWEYRWIDAEGRTVWYRLVMVEPDERLYRAALDYAAERYGCQPDQVINYTPDREAEAYGICLDLNFPPQQGGNDV